MKTGRDARNNMSKTELKKKQEEFRESPLFKEVQQKAEEALGRVRKAMGVAGPILEQLTKPKNEYTGFVVPMPRSPHYITLPPQSRRPTSSEIVITYDSQEAVLMRTIDSKVYTCELTEGTKRKKLFDTLRTQKKYLDLQGLKKILECPTTDSVSTMIKTFNARVANELRMKKGKLIVNKPGSGYRINPDVIIERA